MKKELIVILLLVFVSIELSAQDNEQYGVSLNGGFAFPLGNYGKVYKAGLTGEFTFSYDLEWNTNIYATIGYTSWSLSNDKFNDRFGKGGTYDLKAPISAMPLLIGIRWFWEHEKYAPYFLIEGGIYNYSQEVSGTYTKDGNTEIIRPKNNSFKETAFNFGLGGIWHLNEDVDLDIKVRYHLVSDSETIYYSDIGYDATVNTSKFISVLGGVQFKF